MVFNRFLKFSFIIFTIFLISEAVYGKTSASSGTFISSDEFIKQLRKTGKLGAFDTPAADLFQNVCPGCVKKGSATDSLKFLCETVTMSSACESVDKQDKLDCNNPSQSKEFDTIDFFAGCSVGLFDSVTELLSFVWDVLKWVWNTGTHPIDSYHEASEYAESVKLYLTTEYDKAYDQASSPFKSVKAAKAVAGKIAERLFNTIQEALYAEYLEFGCLNFRARMEMICKLAGEFIIPPAVALALLKKGPKAAAAVAAAWARRSEVIEKLKPGKGKAGSIDGKISPGTKTTPKIAPGETVSVPRSRGGFSEATVEEILPDGRARVTFEENGEKFQKIVPIDSLQKPSTPRASGTTSTSQIAPGETVSVPRSRGGFSEATVEEILPDGRARVTFEENGEKFQKIVPIDSLQKPSTPRASGTTSTSQIAPGEQVSVPRSRGGFSEATVEEILPDGRARVTFEENGEKFQKIVPIDSLQKPSTPRASGTTSTSQIAPGETVSVPRSRGGFSEATVEEILPDGRARVTFEENGEKFQKIVPIDSLQKPSTPPSTGSTAPASRGFARGEIWYDPKGANAASHTGESFPKNIVTSTKDGKTHIDYTHAQSITGKSVTFTHPNGGQFTGVIRGTGGNNGEGGLTFFIIKFKDKDSIKEEVISIEDIDLSQ